MTDTCRFLSWIQLGTGSVFVILGCLDTITLANFCFVILFDLITAAVFFSGTMIGMQYAVPDLIAQRGWKETMWVWIKRIKPRWAVESAMIAEEDWCESEEREEVSIESVMNGSKEGWMAVLLEAAKHGSAQSVLFLEEVRRLRLCLMSDASAVKHKARDDELVTPVITEKRECRAVNVCWDLTANECECVSDDRVSELWNRWFRSARLAGCVPNVLLVDSLTLRHCKPTILSVFRLPIYIILTRLRKTLRSNHRLSVIAQLSKLNTDE